jgi:hypothetical protein
MYDHEIRERATDIDADFEHVILLTPSPCGRGQG